LKLLIIFYHFCGMQGQWQELHANVWMSLDMR
jgi:hypothetical protein